MTHALAEYLPRLWFSVDKRLSSSLSNDKQQFSNEFNVLYSRENNLWADGEQCLTSRGALIPKDLGKTMFSRMLEEAMWKQGRLGPEVGDVRARPAGPLFQGEVVATGKLDCDSCM